MIYDIKTLFKTQGSKEKLRLNVGDLYTALTGPGIQKEYSQHHLHGGVTSTQKHVISLRFSSDSNKMGILISSDPTGNSGDVKAFIYSWIEPIGKEGTSKKENSVLSRVVA